MTVTLSADSVTPRASSSASVSVTSVGSVTPTVFEASPCTFTVLFAASTSLSAAVIVTVPVLDFDPAAMVRTLFELML